MTGIIARPQTFPPGRAFGTVRRTHRYSTTLSALRRARVGYAIRRRRGDVLPLDDWGRSSEDDQAAVVIATWRYLGSGYQSTGEAWLAASALPVPGSSDASPTSRSAGMCG
jgi:hypothetical protein